MKWTAHNLSDLDRIAREFLSHFNKNKKFAFYGDMGSGKTSLIKLLCKHMEAQDTISSPTFAIINEYYSETFGTIYHMDLYRINKPEDLLQIGFEDYLKQDAICLIEWPEIAEYFIDEDFIKISISVGKQNERIIYELTEQ